MTIVMEKSRVRRATTEDVTELCRMLMELSELEPDFNADPVRLRRGLELLTERHGAAVFVADNGGELCGMCTVQTLVSTSEGGAVGLIEDVIVRKGMRRHGIGSMLMEAVLNWSRAYNLTRLQLLADRQNRSALKFYREIGWGNTRMICIRKKLL